MPQSQRLSPVIPFVAIKRPACPKCKARRSWRLRRGAAEVKLSGGQTKAINRLISGEVPGGVLTLVSPEAAEGFPEIASFKIFRITLSPRS